MRMNLKNFFKSKKKLVCVSIIIIALGVITWLLDFDKKIIAGSLLIYGLSTHVLGAIWTSFISLLAGIPWAGPLMVKVIVWPVFIFINVSLYLAQLLRIKKDKSLKFNKEAVSIVFSIGIIIGYILAYIF
ncbi:MAG: hypothetical protein ACMUJM_19625 [bacterium]